jgi:hypothetical protein
MKILIETECGETTCDECDFKRLDFDTARYCTVFRESLGEEYNPLRLPDCLARFGTSTPHPDSGRDIMEVNSEQRAADAYAKQLVDARKMKMHTMEVE